MNLQLWARLKRYGHLMGHFWRLDLGRCRRETLREGWDTKYVGCECSRVFYSADYTRHGRLRRLPMLMAAPEEYRWAALRKNPVVIRRGAGLDQMPVGRVKTWMPHQLGVEVWIEILDPVLAFTEELEASPVVEASQGHSLPPEVVAIELGPSPGIRAGGAAGAGMKIYRLIKVTFDTEENRLAGAVIEQRLETFAGEGAFTKLQDYVARLPLSGHYLGWNDEVYPQLRVDVEEAK